MKNAAFLLKIASVVIVMGSLVGCNSAESGQVGKDFQKGDSVYSWHYASVDRPWANDVTSLVLVGSKVVEQQPVRPTRVRYRLVSREEADAIDKRQSAHQPCEPRVKLVNTTLVNANNASSPGAGKVIVAAALEAAGNAGAACLTKPSKISMRGGNATGGAGGDAAAASSAASSSP